MQVQVLIYHPSSFSDYLYHHALSLMDPDSSSRIRRFYRREDACRTLLGRLLSRTLLRERGVALNDMEFGSTDSGKPYIATPIDPPLGFNVTHDNSLVAIAFAPGRIHAPAFNIGIDVMKVRVPGRESFSSFVQTISEQFTPLELRLLFSEVTQDEALRRFFWMWTLKEAYTKALGLGLGFDFSRVEFDAEKNEIRVDKQIPKGWWFGRFIVRDGNDMYQGVVAEYVGGEQTVVTDELESPEWLKLHDAVSFTEAAILKLGNNKA